MNPLQNEPYRSKLCTAQETADKPVTQYRHHTFFVGTDVRAAIKHGMAEYLPISIAHVPELFNVGRIPLDVALIARLVIAKVNPDMP